MSDYFMKEPCKHCPYRRDVKPFVTQERFEELAHHAQNPYNSFTCHKTLESDEDGEGLIVTEKSLECAGFMTLQLAESGRKPPAGFTPSDKAYNDTWEMIEAGEEYFTHK